MRTQSDFTEGKILGPLLKFSLPVLFAMLLQAMYGAADLLIVGQFGVAADVSAVSTGSQIMQTITSVITGCPWAPRSCWDRKSVRRSLKRPGM